MLLRKLEMKDAPLMLEWMHDEEVTRNLSANFAAKTISDVQKFIADSQNTQTDLHLAVVSDTDLYMGTVSLKHIDRVNGTAEFAISVRRAAMSKGYAWFGMSEILRIGFEELGLNCICWCVSEENRRAVRFYDKHNFQKTATVPPAILQRYQDMHGLQWYAVQKGESFGQRLSVDGCKKIHIQTVPTPNAGELSFFEAPREIPFPIKRLYYITKVPQGVRRGFHAHKQLKQLLFCPYGKIQLLLDDGMRREEIILSDPSVGILIEKPVWREMLWLQADSVLCVAASDYYAPNDYIRDYDAFRQFAQTL